MKAPRETELVRIITSDKALAEDQTKLHKFLSLATYYEEDLQDNIFLTSFDLDKKYNTMDINLWNEFKSHTPIRRYTERFIQELQMVEAQKHVVRSGISRATDAIKVQEVIEGKREADKNTDVLVFLIPQRNYRMND